VDPAIGSFLSKRGSEGPGELAGLNCNDGERDYLSLLKCNPIYLVDGVFTNLITLPGLRPAAMATPIEIGAASLFAAIFRSVLLNPARKFILLGVGQGGGETPSCLLISSFFEYRVSHENG
jgi:hypothetical protein